MIAVTAFIESSAFSITPGRENAAIKTLTQPHIAYRNNKVNMAQHVYGRNTRLLPRNNESVYSKTWCPGNTTTWSIGGNALVYRWKLPQNKHGPECWICCGTKRQFGLHSPDQWFSGTTLGSKSWTGGSGKGLTNGEKTECKHFYWFCILLSCYT